MSLCGASPDGGVLACTIMQRAAVLDQLQTGHALEGEKSEPSIGPSASGVEVSGLSVVTSPDVSTSEPVSAGSSYSRPSRASFSSVLGRSRRLSGSAASTKNMFTGVDVMRPEGATPEEIEKALGEMGRTAWTHRLRVSGPVLATGVLLFALCLGAMMALSFAPGAAAAVPPELVFVCSPTSQAAVGMMLMALQPSDRKGTLVAGVLLCLLCCLQMVLVPLTTWLGPFDWLMGVRAIVLLVLDVLWGLAFFRVGPRQALVSLYKRDDHHRMHPRAALSGLWWTWRLSTITYALVEMTCATIVLVLNAAGGGAASLTGDGCNAEPEPEPEAEPEGEPEPEAEPAARLRVLREAEAEPEAEPGGFMPQQLAPPPSPPCVLVAAPEPEPSPEPTVSLMSPVSIASVALASQFVLFCFALLMTARNRARWRRILGHLDRRGEAHGAAVISAFIGGISPHAAMTVALASFRGLPFGELTEEDLRHAREHDGRADGDTLAAHSTPIEFGGCDGFVSHAWADDHTARWRALSRWAKDFRLARSRDPMCWLDKVAPPFPPPPPSAPSPPPHLTHLHTSPHLRPFRRRASTSRTSTRASSASPSSSPVRSGWSSWRGRATRGGCGASSRRSPSSASAPTPPASR